MYERKIPFGSVAVDPGQGGVRNKEPGRWLNWQRFGIRDRALVPEINSSAKIEYDNYAERGLRSS